MDPMPSPSPCTGVFSSIFGCHRWDRFREAFRGEVEAESGNMEAVSPQEAQMYQQQLGDLIYGRLGQSGESASETPSSVAPSLAPLPSNSPQPREAPPPEVSATSEQGPGTAEETVSSTKSARKMGPVGPGASPKEEPSVETQSAKDRSEKHTNSDHDHHLNHTVKTVCIVLAAVCLSVVIIGTAFGLYFTYIYRSRDIDICLLD